LGGLSATRSKTEPTSAANLAIRTEEDPSNNHRGAKEPFKKKRQPAWAATTIKCGLKEALKRWGGGLTRVCRRRCFNRLKKELFRKEAAEKRKNKKISNIDDVPEILWTAGGNKKKR